jgi:hypothetical protein
VKSPKLARDAAALRPRFVGTPVGYRAARIARGEDPSQLYPIYPIAGGAPDDQTDDEDKDNPDDDPDQNDDEDPDDDADADSSWKPPTKEEWDRLNKAKKQVTAESIRRKRMLREAGIDPATGERFRDARDDDDADRRPPKKRRDDDDDTDVRDRRTNSKSRRRDEDDDDYDDRRSRRKAKTYDEEDLEELAAKRARRLADREVARVEAESEKRMFALIGSVNSELSEAGFSGKMDRAMRLIDWSNVDVDTDGEVIGLDDEVAKLKSDFPEMFGNRRRRTTRTTTTDNVRKSTRDDDDDDDRPASNNGRKKKPLTWEQRLAKDLV